MLMLCKSPFTVAGRAYGCGQCMPCRLNRRRIWTHRIMLEAGQYGDNAFVTLTYSDETLPEGGNLVPGDLQLWLKRLRKAFPNRLRFFGVGEYGDASFRPHYHVALFNYPTCRYGMSTYNRSRSKCCFACDLVASTWAKGNVLLGGLQESSAAYIAGYVTKKMTSAGDARLGGRHPEFSRMSLRPGIGGDAMWEVADVLMRYDLDETEVDVPNGLRHGGRILPLGRYLQRRVRSFVGKDEGTPDEIIEKIDAELLPLRLAAKSSESSPALSQHVVRENKGRVARLEAKTRIFGKKRETL